MWTPGQYMQGPVGNQALADALRGTAASGGTQMPGRASSFTPGSVVGMPDSPSPQSGQLGSNLGGIAKGLYGMFNPATTGADIGQAAATYGPEVAKMPGLAEGGAASGFGAWAAPVAAAMGAYGLDEYTKNDANPYSARNLNNYGTANIGGKDIGFRAGDAVNMLNPATYLRNPKEGVNSLVNFFTAGLLD